MWERKPRLDHELFQILLWGSEARRHGDDAVMKTVAMTSALIARVCIIGIVGFD